MDLQIMQKAIVETQIILSKCRVLLCSWLMPNGEDNKYYISPLTTDHREARSCDFNTERLLTYRLI